jgi:predicted phage terminase large subunit-like protein
MTRQQAIDFLLNRPVEYARMLGFTKLSSLHNKWIVDMVRGKDDKTLQSSRGTYKTTCVSVALALIIILLPNKRTMFMRKTDGDVKEVLKQVQKILNDPHTQYFVQAIYGVNLRMMVSSATEILTNLTTDTKGTAQLVGIGTGASLTGKHFDRIFTDDIVNVQDRISKAERDRTKIIYQELQNIKNRGGRIFNTGTPWHKDDAFSIMPEPERYDCYQEDVRQIISEEELEDIRSKMVPSLFAANYELRFIASDDVIFVSPRVGGDPAMVEQGIVHIDAAYGGEDYTAATYCRKSNGTYYILGKLWHRAVDEVEDDIIGLRKKFNCGKVFCEDNADKGYLAKSLRKKGERVVTYHETENKYMKIVTNLKPEWKNVVFVDGTDPEYIEQICDYNEDADHDDAPDSLSSVVRHLLKKKDSEINDGKYKSVYGGIYG